MLFQEQTECIQSKDLITKMNTLCEICNLIKSGVKVRKMENFVEVGDNTIPKFNNDTCKVKCCKKCYENITCDYCGTIDKDEVVRRPPYQNESCCLYCISQGQQEEGK